MKKKILFIAIFIITIFSFSTCFALTGTQLEAVLEYKGVQNNSKINRENIMKYASTYQFLVIQENTGSITFYFTNTAPVLESSNSVHVVSARSVEIFRSDYLDRTTDIYLSLKSNFYFYTNTNIFKSDGELAYPAGYENKELISKVEEPEPDFQATLPEIYQETNLGAVMEEIVGILPILVVCLVSWIGLRKGLAFLSRILNNS